MSSGGGDHADRDHALSHSDASTFHLLTGRSPMPPPPLPFPAENDFLRKMNREHVGVIPPALG